MNPKHNPKYWLQLILPPRPLTRKAPKYANARPERILDNTYFPGHSCGYLNIAINNDLAFITGFENYYGTW